MLKSPRNLDAALSRELVGQPDAVQAILPFVQMYEAGLAPERRPAGIFLLLGPTGTGKTHTVEVLAEVLHGDRRKVLQINCGELQADHEIAKLVGAPPGYIGHRETRPLLSQSALADATSRECGLSLVLFDEIEKASPALMPLLLGAFDKGTMQLGDGTVVDFTHSMIFLTSNLGAREMMRELAPSFGFGPPPDALKAGDVHSRLENIAVTSVRRRFSPEFVNRLDAIVTYKPLDTEALEAILGQQIDDLREHVRARLGRRAFEIEVSAAARRFLLEVGTSAEYGARELKRTVQRLLTQPLAMMVASGEIGPGSVVSVDMNDEGTGFTFTPSAAASVEENEAAPMVLIVEQNVNLLNWLGRVLSDTGYAVVLAESPDDARDRLGDQIPDAALVALDSAASAQFARELLALSPAPHVTLMLGPDAARFNLSAGLDVRVPVLRKPFLGQDVVSVLQGRIAETPVRVSHLRAS